MDTLEAIKQRRAVKHYDESFSMPEEDERQLDAVVRDSPTAFNIQNWRVVKVKDKVLREQLREAAWGQEQVTQASLLYVFCADLMAWDKEPNRYWQNAPKEVAEAMVGMIGGYYRDKPEVMRDEAMRSCGIAASHLMLAAKSLGYDSCPMDGFDFAKVGELINLPSDHVIAMFVVVGKPTAPARPKGGFVDDSEVFISDRF